MFVFKTAVVGAGTMGGEIAQTLAAADLPVVLKDVDQKFVDQGLEKAREVTEGQLQGLVKKEKLTEEQAKAAARAHGGPDHRHDRLRRASATSTSSSRRCPSGSRSSGRCSPSSTPPRPGHAILASNTSSLSITEMGDATLRPDKVVGFHYFYPASVMRLIEVVEGEETSEETRAGDDQLRAADPQDADPLRRGAGLRGEPGPQLGGERDLALQGRVRRLRAGHRQGDRGRAGHADGPVLPQRPARARHGAARRRAPAGVLRRPLLRLARDAGAGGGGQLRAEDRQGLLRARGTGS